ncbi:MAG: hypothetical protein WCI05_03110 [Myxococcales bacterium]
MPSELHRVKGVIGVSPKNATKFLAFAVRVHGLMLAASATYASPSPTPAILLAAITTAQTAQQATVGNRNNALSTARNTAFTALLRLLELDLVYVQGLADADPANAASLITGAGFKVAETPVHEKDETALSLPPGTSGVIEVDVNLTKLAGRKVAKKILVHSQYCITGGTTWVKGTPSAYAKFQISDIPLNSLVRVQVAVEVGKVMGPWVDAGEIFVR